MIAISEPGHIQYTFIKQIRMFRVAPIANPVRTMSAQAITALLKDDLCIGIAVQQIVDCLHVAYECVSISFPDKLRQAHAVVRSQMNTVKVR